ncbi:ABC transporter permease [Croceicoccus estronivorus]|uniref:ABC transporter permease n=1 Tax=Croceicoccus estronivorus TaxID=1172626 RepID=UPI000834BA41|nr:ABC transporter permease [Croceicoccus estronivorus]OCC23904.1 ABC transporter permease [Croceicoccus estronivorus]
MNPGRLSLLQAAFVIARRDFVAVLFSRAFFFFLLGPLFPVIVGAMAGSIGVRVAQEADRPVIGVAMAEPDRQAMLASYDMLAPRLGNMLPRMERMGNGATDPTAELERPGNHLIAVVGGTVAAPLLTGPKDTIERWQGPISLIAAEAAGEESPAFPAIALSATATSGAKENGARIRTAQAGQTLLFLLTMLLAGMVLSNLVEEKGNKVIEILAAAIPMDAVFLGKLFAMLGVSLVGIAVWSAVGGAIFALAGQSLPSLPAPAVGWPLFFVLGTAYFAMAYLLLGSIFLAIGAMAATVRDVQTLSMPVTMMQLVVFFFAGYALSQPGSAVEMAAIAFPLSSPFAMLARAAREPALWPHVAALAWQALAVGLFVKTGAAMFRQRVMKSAGARGTGKGLRARWRRLFGRTAGETAAVHR